MILITDVYDIVCVVISLVGMMLIAYQLHEVDWDIEKLLFESEDE